MNRLRSWHEFGSRPQERSDEDDSPPVWLPATCYRLLTWRSQNQGPVARCRSVTTRWIAQESRKAGRQAIQAGLKRRGTRQEGEVCARIARALSSCDSRGPLSARDSSALFLLGTPGRSRTGRFDRHHPRCSDPVHDHAVGGPRTRLTSIVRLEKLMSSPCSRPTARR